jgi:adenylyltransferase/sulfurtransferase
VSIALSLTDAQIERYSRQILLPEIGGRGQARLLAAHVVLAGDGEAATAAAVLLGRAGVGALDLLGHAQGLPEVGPDCRLRQLALTAAATLAPDVLVDLGGDRELTTALGRRAQAAGCPHIVGRLAGARATVATLLGHPCVACLPRAILALEEQDPVGPVGPLAAPAALAAGALAASEALRVLLFPPAQGRVHTLACAEGIFAAEPLPSTSGCPVCGSD